MITFAVLGTSCAASYVYLHFADGPVGPLPGGPLQQGEWVQKPGNDWQAVTNNRIQVQTEPYFVELQLEAGGRSRTTGILLHNNRLYIPCDLGFGWARFTGTTRWILHLIYLLKDWHHQAMADGRAVLRMENRRYPRQAVRVTDPQLIETLKQKLETLTAQWQAPQPLAPRPTSGPRDIWFFELRAR